MSTAIVEVQNAVAEFDKVAAGIAELQKRYSGVVFDVRTSKGMDEAKKARQEIRTPRYEIERLRKDAKAPILKLGKEIDDRAKTIKEEILKIEEPIDQQITAEEDRKEAEKQAKIVAEQKRVEGIQSRIDAIRNWPANAAGKPASLVEQQLRNAADYIVGEDFEEFTNVAHSALATSVIALKEIHAERLAHEAEQERIKAEREELAQLRAEAEKHAAAERARLEEEERKARAEREAEAARQAEELRQERARLEEDQRAAREKQEAEAAAERQRIAEEEAKARAIREEEARKLAEERSEFERQQEAARIQREQEEADARERSRLAALTKPSDAEIVAVLAAHYRAPEAMVAGWLSQMDLSEAA